MSSSSSSSDILPAVVTITMQRSKNSVLLVITMVYFCYTPCRGTYIIYIIHTVHSYYSTSRFDISLLFP